MRPDLDGRHVRIGEGPRMPADCMRALGGAEIGPAASSCGTATKSAADAQWPQEQVQARAAELPAAQGGRVNNRKLAWTACGSPAKCPRALYSMAAPRCCLHALRNGGGGLVLDSAPGRGRVARPDLPLHGDAALALVA